MTHWYKDESDMERGGKKVFKRNERMEKIREMQLPSYSSVMLVFSLFLQYMYLVNVMCL